MDTNAKVKCSECGKRIDPLFYKALHPHRPLSEETQLIASATSDEVFGEMGFGRYPHRNGMNHGT